MPILYEDDWLIAVDKPAGLLSVPGRYHDRQDSVLSRLRVYLPDGATVMPIHRLDQDTSGLLLFARDRHSYLQLVQQFQQRLIHKGYEALLAGTEINPHWRESGLIDLPLWGDPSDRPRQTVDWQRGKPSLTKFRILAQNPDQTRIEFLPLTGRTHQLRVHAADRQGLGVPIWGDRLYGDRRYAETAATDRLHLHAREIHCTHPDSGQSLQLYAKTPF